VVDKYSEKDEKRAKKKKQLFTSIPTRIRLRTWYVGQQKGGIKSIAF